MDDIFHGAFDPPAPTVLGRRLKPLCLAHVVTLGQADSIFLKQDPDRKPTVVDVAVAAWFCSKPGFLPGEEIPEPDMERMIRWASIAGRRYKPEVEQQKLIDYLKQSLRFPRFWAPENGGRPTVAPWEFTVVSALVEAGITRREAWTMPVAEALAHYAATMERKGLELVSDWEKRQIEKLEKKTA